MSAIGIPAAFVAGGSDGIGLATAALLGERGHKVVIGGRDEKRLADAAALLASRNIDVTTAPLDTTSSECTAVVEGIAATHGIGILVNCVGSAPAGTFDDVPDESWLKSFDTKVVGAVRTMRGVVPQMRKAGYGRIVNVAGTAGREPDSWMVVAGAANAALVAVTNAAAAQLAPEGITVNAVCPGPVRTSRWDGLVRTYSSVFDVDAEQARRQLEGLIPSGGPAEPDDVAGMIGYLTSPEARHVTGAAMTIDGGQSRSI